MVSILSAVGRILCFIESSDWGRESRFLQHLQKKSRKNSIADENLSFTPEVLSGHVVVKWPQD